MAVIAVTSGTTGAGKTTVATNLAAVLGRVQRRVVLFDATPGPSVAARRLGLLERLDQTACSGDVRVVTPNVRPGGRGLTARQTAELAEFIRALSTEADDVIVDTATFSSSVASLVACADAIALVSATHRSATSRAVSVIRRISTMGSRAAIGLVVNGMTDREDGERAFRVVADASRRRLNRNVEAYGAVTADPDVARAQMMQRAVVDCRPDAPASRCFEALARRIANRGPSGGGGPSQFPQSDWDMALSPSSWPMETRKCA